MNTKKLLGTAFGLSAIAFMSCQDTEIVRTEMAEQSEIVRAGEENGDVIQGQYIVVLKGHLNRLPANASYEARTAAAKDAAQAIFRRNGIAAETEQAYGKAIFGFSGKFTDEQIAKISQDGDVAYVESDRVISIMRGKPGSGGGGSSSQTTPWGITRVGGGANYTGSGVAWVVDSGVDLDHPDLNVDVARSRTFITSGKDSKSADDGNGHGSHVAGTIAAINNGYGVVGVAAGATVVAVKVLGATGSGSYSGVIAGIDYVAAAGKAGDVANLSLGGPVSQAVDDAVVAAAQSGVKFVLAAGNESQDANNSSPARANGNNIYTISASDVNDRYASFSNYGNPPVDFCEPGVSIQSTYKGGAYASLSGTSMAAPHAAGLLLWGNIANGGTVSNDPDGNADTIGVR